MNKIFLFLEEFFSYRLLANINFLLMLLEYLTTKNVSDILLFGISSLIFYFLDFQHKIHIMYVVKKKNDNDNENN